MMHRTPPCGVLREVRLRYDAQAETRIPVQTRQDALRGSSSAEQVHTTRAGCQKAVRRDSRKSASFSGVLDHVGCYVLPVDILRERTLRADNSAFLALFADDRQDNMTSMCSQTL